MFLADIPEECSGEWNSTCMTEPSTSVKRRPKRKIQPMHSLSHSDELSEDEGDFIPSEEEKEYLPDSDEDLSSENASCRSEKNIKKKRTHAKELLKTPIKKRKCTKKQEWTPRSTKFLEQRFHSFIYTSTGTKLPGKQLIESAQDDQKAPSPLKHRSWRLVKDFIRNKKTKFQSGKL